MERLVFLDRCTVQAPFRPPAFPHVWRDYATTSLSEVVERLADATLVVTNKVPLRAEAIARLPALKFIAVAATGVDLIDLAACRARGIPVSNVRGYARHTVPEHVFMLALALRRNLIGFREDLAAGAWQQAPGFCLFSRPIGDLHGATLGLVGHGSLAQGVERLAVAFGMRVMVAERRGAPLRPGRLPFEQVLAESDVLSLHCPLTPETRNLMGPAEFAAMKPGAVLINTARGALVDAPALLAALQSGHLGGAGIDVLPEEPPVHGHPYLEVRHPNLIVTPHVAWASQQAQQALADQVVENLEAFVAGSPRNVVT